MPQNVVGNLLNIVGGDIAPAMHECVCLRRLNKIFFPIIVRVPIIPNFNDNIDVQKRIYKFVKDLHNVERIELLPYNRLAISKCKGLGIDYELKDVLPLKKADLHYLEELGKRIRIKISINV